MVIAVVREWRSDEGWGVLDCDETPGGCWAHFSAVEMPGYRALCAGQIVDLDWEEGEQDGFQFRAVAVRLGEYASFVEAVPGIAPQTRLPASQTLEVDGEVFDLRPDGAGGMHYDWVSGPNPGRYGFSTSPTPDSIEQHVASVRDFLSMIEPATGYIEGD